MEKWEYLTKLVRASNNNWRAKESIEFYDHNYGAVREPIKPNKFSPQYMIGILNNVGEEGWELVHMQPVLAGKHDDIGHGSHATGSYDWSNWYFCVFKRRRQG